MIAAASGANGGDSGSARLVGQSQGEGFLVRDNVSRFGLCASKDFAREYEIYACLELGVNLVEAVPPALMPIFSERRPR